MEGDDYAARLASVRNRFASKLEGRIAEIDTALSQLAGEGAEVANAVYTAHRHLHDLCGIGPTLGFNETGKAARVCERILLQPSRGERGLTEQEMAQLKQGLAALRAAAWAEVQAVETVPE